MKWVISILFSSLFMVSCMPNPNNVSGNRATGNLGGPMNPQVGNQPLDNSDEWGGLTCAGGSNDQAFRDFLSSVKEVYDERRSEVGKISCTPSSNQGFLIRAKVTLLGLFNPNGDNQNIPMQAESSYLEIKIFDGPLPIEKTQEFIYIKMFGNNGSVTGNQANLIFEDSKGIVTLEGSFTSTEFTGSISFDNRVVLIDGAEQSPGKRGTLGKFRLNTGATFFDTTSPSSF